MKRIVMTVCHVISGNQILLGMKKVRIGKGLWNGFGGRVESGEAITLTAAREVEEECGLKPLDMKKCGIALVTRESSDEAIELHFFITSAFEGVVRESDEMTPRWFPIRSIPFEEMWPNDSHTLPLFLEGKQCVAYFHLASDKSVIKHDITLVDVLPDTIEDRRL